jgi:hypothetical protein
MIAYALMAISEIAGPGAVREILIIAIETAKKKLGFFDDLGESSYECSQFVNNNMCIHRECPFYPNRK